MAEDAKNSKENDVDQVSNGDKEGSFGDEKVSNLNIIEDEANIDTSVCDDNDVDQQLDKNTSDTRNAHEFKAPNFAVPSAPLSLSTKGKNEKSIDLDLDLLSDSHKSPKHASSDMQELCQQFPYKEPDWGGEAEEEYSFDVLKNGSIIENIPLKLKGQSYFVFGRLQSCHVTLEHPSLSRYHAVIQHSNTVSNLCEKGWYIYDLDSTHGTWVNKRRLKPKHYYRLKVGYVIKFGGSSRLHILQGPDYDAEEESELSVTELREQRDKQKREAELLRQNELLEKQRQQEAEQKLLEDQSCSWGLGEDAKEVEEENPFAAVVPENESLYIDDPKKALKGFYEREGCDLPDYQFTEVSIGKHKCRLEIPVDGPNGEELIAEALVSGKKKDAVIACALEACRLLDRMSMLRQSQHEGRKRKARNWEADDFYDSDEDTFLDRTGTIEKKRFMRMKKAGKDEVETFESLMEKYTAITSQITEIETKLHKAKAEAEALAKEDMDELDAYMFSIKSGAMDTKTRMRLKGELLHLKMEEKRLFKLVNVARPASMPPLKIRVPETPNISDDVANRLKQKQLQRKEQKKISSSPKVVIDIKPDNFEEEDEEEEDRQQEKSPEKSKTEILSSETKLTDLMSAKEETMDMSDSSRLKSTEIDRLCQSPDSKPPVSKGPHLPHPSSSPVVPSKLQRKPHRFSTAQALDALDRPISKKQPSQPKTQFEEHDPDYAIWLPPSEQSGDGRTSLNEKLGY